MRASATVASILARLRTMPASCISASFFLSLQRTIFFRVEAVERFAEGRALAQDGDPGEPGLEAVEHELLEHRPIVVFGHAPFLVVIGDVERIDARPRAARQSVGALDRRQDARRLFLFEQQRLFFFGHDVGLVFLDASLKRRAKPFDRPRNPAHRLRLFVGQLKGIGHDVSRHSSRQDRRRAGRQARRHGRVRAHGRRRDDPRDPFDRQLQGRAGAERKIAGYPPVSHGARRRSRRNRREFAPLGLRARRRGRPDRLWAQRDPFRRLCRKGAGERRLAGQAAGRPHPVASDGDRHRGLHRDAGADGDRAPRPHAVLRARRW